MNKVLVRLRMHKKLMIKMRTQVLFFSLVGKLAVFCFRSDKKQTRQPALKRLEDAIKLHRDDKGQAVLNPALLALFRASSSELKNKIQKIREQRDIVTGKRVVYTSDKVILTSNTKMLFYLASPL